MELTPFEEKCLHRLEHDHASHEDAVDEHAGHNHAPGEHVDHSQAQAVVEKTVGGSKIRWNESH